MPLHNTLDKACDKGETSEELNSHHRMVENLIADPPQRAAVNAAASLSTVGVSLGLRRTSREIKFALGFAVKPGNDLSLCADTTRDAREGAPCHDAIRKRKRWNRRDEISRRIPHDFL
jgi:hypothetical protein